MGSVNNINQEKVTRYRNMYIRELITENQLDKLVEKGVLTPEEKNLIIAEPNY